MLQQLLFDRTQPTKARAVNLSQRRGYNFAQTMALHFTVYFLRRTCNLTLLSSSNLCINISVFDGTGSIGLRHVCLFNTFSVDIINISPIPSDISPTGLKRVIEKLTALDPLERWGMDEIACSQWFQVTHNHPIAGVARLSFPRGTVTIFDRCTIGSQFCPVAGWMQVFFSQRICVV